ncbi:HNH endonuclease signature motif containing protein [Bifidobacterium phasiani]|uniref:HNH endonuclease n=1 Tax=Bifidobacterium phasiani TaxID=2834431 RepID=A0ABS6WBA8_9BIFI|nr:HNH endonuclease signature motif containing protein [Bifidobacterium phasiani]MBW3083798.1 HNH endonuclease [Bifidobacterium phasiani]
MSTRRQAISPAVKARVTESYGTGCWLRFPGCTGRADTLDHLLPYSKGGTDSVRNLRPACRHCNSLRADRLIQGRGVEVHVLMSSPRIGMTWGKGAPAMVLDFERMLGVVSERHGLDDDAWSVAEAMWKGAAARALRIRQAMPLVLCPPATIAAGQWREWLRLGYDIEVTDARSTRDMRCDRELKALVAWMRSGVSMRGVERAVRARDDDWRRMGLVF